MWGLVMVTDLSLVFVNSFGHKFQVNWPVLEILCTYEQSVQNAPEAGGILLGRYIRKCNDVIVDQITVPLKGDIQKRKSFFRLSKLHQSIADEVWKNSNGTINYLGEWHTHPENEPFPSLVDRIDWQKKVTFDKYDSDTLFFLIVGIRTINVWQGFRGKVAFEKLRIIESKSRYQ